jgi:hypothetical protein
MDFLVPFFSANDYCSDVIEGREEKRKFDRGVGVVYSPQSMCPEAVPQLEIRSEAPGLYAYQVMLYSKVTTR